MIDCGESSVIPVGVRSSTKIEVVGRRRSQKVSGIDNIGGNTSK